MPARRAAAVPRFRPDRSLRHADRNRRAERGGQEFAAAHPRRFGAAHGPDAALERVGLAAQGELPVGYLSAGQRRRLALGRCWMLGRPLWLLDEPTAALDTAGRALAADLIGAHLAAGGTALAATHEPILAGAAQASVA